MKRAFVPGLALLPAIALAGCNRQPTVHAENASVAEVAAKAKAAEVKIEPGQWTSKIELLALDIPGIKDKRMLDGMKNAMQRSQTAGITHCVTEEEASKPPEKMFAGNNAGQCRYDNFTMAGGRLNATMTCKSPDGKGAMTMKMAGSFTGRAYDIVSEMNTNASGVPGGQGMSMKAHVIASRTGECTGKEDVKPAPPAKG